MTPNDNDYLKRLRDEFATHAPPVPPDGLEGGFPRIRASYDITTGVTTPNKTDLERMVRWRWHYAELMIAASPYVPREST